MQAHLELEKCGSAENSVDFATLSLFSTKSNLKVVRGVRRMLRLYFHEFWYLCLEKGLQSNRDIKTGKYLKKESEAPPVSCF